MSSKRTWLWVLLIVAVGAAFWYRQSVFPTRPEADVPRVVFVTGGTGPFWQLTVNGATQAAEDHNAEIEIKTPEQEESAAEQTTIVLNLNRDAIDGLAISPLDAEAQTLHLNQLASEMPVVTFDADAPLSERQYYVGTSNYRAGQLCADLMAEALPEGGEVAVLFANLTKQNLIERQEGLAERLSEREGLEISIVAELVDEGDTQRCQENIRQALADHPDLAGLIGMNAHHGPVLIEVLEAEDKLGDMKLVAFDEAEETLAGVENGHIHGTVVQDPYMYGYEAVRMLVKLHTGDHSLVPIVGRGAVNVQCEVLRQGDVDDFRQRLAHRLNGEATDADEQPPSGAANDGDTVDP